MTIVLDASALLAALEGEPGAERVQAAIAGGAVMHAVNFAEVLSKLAERGLDPEAVERDLTERGVLHHTLHLDPGVGTDAADVARLRPLTRAHGLSLGDRYCLTLARRLGRPALTADRAWRAVQVGVEIHVLRGD